MNFLLLFEFVFKNPLLLNRITEQVKKIQKSYCNFL